MNTTRSAMCEARALLYRRCGGILSLQSEARPGFPDATPVSFCLDLRGRPVFMLHGPLDNPAAGEHRVSLTIIDTCAHAGRLSLLGEVEAVDDGDELSAARFRRYYPLPPAHQLPSDTAFWSLRPLHVRHVDRDGEVHWLDPEELLLLNPLHPDDERDFVCHMNRCHTAAMRRYCERADILVPRDVEPTMAGIDALGFHLRLGARFIRFDFSRPVTAVPEMRMELLAMARNETSMAIH